ncbi:MAG: hypothetical protein HC900_10245 [Methylacidiphilales bacterium]|nr:hypothetical protein [Candidatus Methylacidiphilales bacterium]
MTQSGSWNKRSAAPDNDGGITADALDAARAAAEREGVTLERWLQRALLAEGGEGGERGLPRRSAPGDHLAGPDARREAPAREPEPAQPGAEGVAAALGEVSRRLNALLGEVAGSPPRAGRGICATAQAGLPAAALAPTRAAAWMRPSSIFTAGSTSLRAISRR